jgi:hypothetical protein
MTPTPDLPDFREEEVYDGLLNALALDGRRYVSTMRNEHHRRLDRALAGIAALQEEFPDELEAFPPIHPSPISGSYPGLDLGLLDFARRNFLMADRYGISLEGVNGERAAARLEAMAGKRGALLKKMAGLYAAADLTQEE